jgi:phosphoribosylglycinamide formyltransferase-1
VFGFIYITINLMKSIVILISGRGSNMQALLEAALPVRIAAVISNNPDAAGSCNI